MPQMAPLSWLSLFIIFSITLVIFNAMNYFLYTPFNSSKSDKTSSKKFNTNPMNWKW